MPTLLSRASVLALAGLVIFSVCHSAAPLSEVCQERGAATLTKPLGEEVCVAKISKEECALGEGQWGRHGSSANDCLDRHEEQDCRRKQGDWTRQGLRGIYGCVLKATDAGKACNSGSECQFKRCVYVESRHLPGRSWTGQCAATDSQFGCYRLVENGAVMPGLCAD